MVMGGLEKCTFGSVVVELSEHEVVALRIGADCAFGSTTADELRMGIVIRRAVDAPYVWSMGASGWSST